MPSARRLTRLEEERDGAGAELESVRAALVETQMDRDRLEAHNRELGAHIHNLADQNRRMAAEVARLRSGYGGLLRRVRARLLGN